MVGKLCAIREEYRIDPCRINHSLVLEKIHVQRNDPRNKRKKQRVFYQETQGRVFQEGRGSSVEHS